MTSSETELSEDFEDLYETAPCGYVSLSPSGRICKLNGTLAQWLGRDAGELISRPVHEILSFGGKIAFETHLAPLLRMQGHVHEIALDLLHADGSKIPTIANAAEKRDTAGGHQFTRLTLFLAVDRRTYERNLLDARLSAEAEVKAHSEAGLLREQFIAVLGHDLRNPLSAIAAGIEMLEKHGHQGGVPVGIRKEMRASVERAVALVNDILDLARSRLGSGLDVERRSSAPLTPVLEQVVTEARAIAPDRTIETRFDIAEPVYCDPGRIAQLASNLIANALTHGAADQPVLVEANTVVDRFLLSVANAGAAIPEEARTHLFQPFFRGGVRSSQNGLGLGLYIASEIAKAHEGVLDVRSTDEETRFTLSIPRTAEAAPSNQ